MLPYHIKITENETGKTLLEMDACAIIGAIGDEESATVVADYDCNGLALVGTIITAFRALERTIEKLDPIERMLIEDYMKKGDKK